MKPLPNHQLAIPPKVEDLEVKDAQVIFTNVWNGLESDFGHDQLRFAKEIILLGGAPGSGKGTHTQFITRVRGLTCPPIVVSSLLDTPEARQIKEAGGEFIWVIKGNQPTLLKEIEGLFALQTPTVLGGLVPNDFVSYETVHKGHGRLERRRITVSSELRGYANWPYSQQVFRLERQRITLKTGKLETEVVYGLTSLCRKAASAKQLHDFARDYWGIENGLHHRRDVTFNEDRTRQTLGHAGRVMASLNNLAISLFRHAGFTNIAHARRIFNGLLNHTTYLSLQRPLT